MVRGSWFMVGGSWLVVGGWWLIDGGCLYWRWGGMKRRFDQIVLLLFLLWLTGCVTSPEIIEDIRTLPQDNTFYLDQFTANREVVAPERQRILLEDFNRHFFLPWNQAEASNSREAIAKESARYRNHPGYGENSRKHSQYWFEELARNADLENYPNARFKAITIDHSDLRLLPTLKPHFSSLKADGTGYPFDNLQKSAIPANTPLFVAHVASDKSWVLVDSHYGSGWLPARDVAVVDPNLMALWEHSDHVAITRDDVPVYDLNGRFLFKTSLGARFPVVAEDGDNYRIVVAQADDQGTAQSRQAIIPRGTANLQPLKLTQTNIAAVANELINRPYGWGGLYGNRDCSAMLKDLFAPFGLWLPRHSSNQALQGGVFIDLSDLEPSARERMILRRGVPFLTLIWAKGHIMLYLGNDQGRAVVFHNQWGIKTRDLLGREGRKVVGHAAITTLHPGAELPDLDDPDGDMLNRVEGMTLLAGAAP